MVLWLGVGTETVEFEMTWYNEATGVNISEE